MKQRGLRGASRAKKRFTTHADAGHLRAPDLVKRNFTATRPDALWVADFTYCSTWSGVVYVAFIIDVFSRRLVGWKASRSMTAPLVVDALNMAAWTRRHQSLDGLVCHTDYAEVFVKPRNPDLASSRGFARMIPRLNVSVLSQAVEGLELVVGEVVLGGDFDCRGGGVDGDAHHVDGGERVERRSG